MLQHLRSKKNHWLALVAAFFLVLQAAHGANASSSRVGLDAFGNPLCISGVNHGTDPTAPSSDHSGMPDCCTLACGAAAHLAFAGSLIFLFERPFAADGELIATSPEISLGQLEEFQGSPRAPPRLS